MHNWSGISSLPSNVLFNSNHILHCDAQFPYDESVFSCSSFSSSPVLLVCSVPRTSPKSLSVSGFSASDIWIWKSSHKNAIKSLQCTTRCLHKSSGHGHQNVTTINHGKLTVGSGNGLIPKPHFTLTVFTSHTQAKNLLLRLRMPCTGQKVMSHFSYPS